MAKKLISYDDTKPGLGLPDVVGAKINARYATKAELQSAVSGAGNVASPSVSRIIASSDPDTPLMEGDLLLLYAPPLTHFEDWSDGLDGWHQPWAQLEWTQNTTDDGYSARRVVTGPTRTALAYESAPIQDVEVVAKIEVSNLEDGYFGGGVGVRVSGAPGEEQAYGVFVRYNRVVLSRFYPGGFTTHHSSTEFVAEVNRPYWVRVRIHNGTMEARFWHDGDAEPTGWMLTYSGLTELETGQVALLTGSMQGIVQYHRVGVAELDTGTESAPMVAP